MAKNEDGVKTKKDELIENQTDKITKLIDQCIKKDQNIFKLETLVKEKNKIIEEQDKKIEELFNENENNGVEEDLEEMSNCLDCKSEQIEKLIEVRDGLQEDNEEMLNDISELISENNSLKRIIDSIQSIIRIVKKK